jgi:chromosome transmission fidelity protein 18
MFYLLQSIWKFHLTVETERTGQARDPHVKRPILRPIICICNDINASSLVKLRSYALQVRFNRPADIHIVKRLKEICQIESLKVDSRALNTLVSIAKGDLRGCLNALQVCEMAIIFSYRDFDVSVVHQSS